MSVLFLAFFLMFIYFVKSSQNFTHSKKVKSVQNFDQPEKEHVIKFLSLKDFNDTISYEQVGSNVIDTIYTERFAKQKGNSKEYYIWMAPKSSVGSPWPQPTIIRKKQKIYYLADNLEVITKSGNCALITAAVNRYKDIIFKYKRVTHILQKDEKDYVTKCQKLGDINCQINKISISVKYCSKKDFPGPNMNESYFLHVDVNEIIIRARETWGLLRALETLSQLVYCIFTETLKMLVIKGVEIYDQPMYSYRGLMLDTSRHYIPFEDILKTLDAMEMNKLNVFHWHITDDQSFPFGSKLHPELFQKGVFEKSMVYNYSTMKRIIQYARERGIRVIPEIDVPGHTGSWSISHPELMSHCFETDGTISDFGPLNPTLVETFALITDIFSELVSIFPDTYIHLGIDEVGLRCWKSDIRIIEFMKRNNIINYDRLIVIFINELQKIIKNKFPYKKIIVWQDAYEKTFALTASAVIQIWKSDLNDLQRFYNSKRSLIYSTDFYLDKVGYGPAWVKFYEKGFGSKYDKHFIGGEACMWNEFQSKETIHSKIWPTTSALAEKLWSGSAGSIINVASRLEEHRCRMIRRDIPVGVAGGPSECLYLNIDSYFNTLSDIASDTESSKLYEFLKYYLLFVIGICFGYHIQVMKWKLRRYIHFMILIPVALIVFHILLLLYFFI